MAAYKVIEREREREREKQKDKDIQAVATCKLCNSFVAVKVQVNFSLTCCKHGKIYIEISEISSEWTLNSGNSIFNWSRQVSSCML